MYEVVFSFISELSEYIIQYESKKYVTEPESANI